jgi:hypothetical protein
MSWFDGFLSGRPSGLHGCSIAPSSRSRSGVRPSAKHRATKKTWASSGTCTGSYFTKATASPKSGWRTRRSSTPVMLVVQPMRVRPLMIP